MGATVCVSGWGLVGVGDWSLPPLPTGVGRAAGLAAVAGSGGRPGDSTGALRADGRSCRRTGRTLRCGGQLHPAPCGLSSFLWGIRGGQSGAEQWAGVEAPWLPEVLAWPLGGSGGGRGSEGGSASSHSTSPLLQGPWGGLASSLGLHLTLGGRGRKGILQNPRVFWVEPQGEGLSAPFPPQALLRGGHSCRNILTPGQAMGKPRSLLASSPVKSLSQPPGHRRAKRAGKGERVCKERRSCQLPRSEGAGTTSQASRGPGPCVAEVVGMAVATTCWVHGHGHLTVHRGPPSPVPGHPGTSLHPGASVCSALRCDSSTSSTRW